MDCRPSPARSSAVTSSAQREPTCTRKVAPRHHPRAPPWHCNVFATKHHEKSAHRARPFQVALLFQPHRQVEQRKRVVRLHLNGSPVELHGLAVVVLAMFSKQRAQVVQRRRVARVNGHCLPVERLRVARPVQHVRREQAQIGQRHRIQRVHSAKLAVGAKARAVSTDSQSDRQRDRQTDRRLEYKHPVRASHCPSTHTSQSHQCKTAQRSGANRCSPNRRRVRSPAP